MADRTGTTDPNSTHTDTRRWFLAALGAGTNSWLAGCSSGGGDDGSDAAPTETTASRGANANGDGGTADESGPTEGGGTGDGTSGENGGDGSERGGDGGGATSESGADAYADPCPMPPFSYSQQTYEAPNDPVASFTMDAPEFPEIVKSGGIAFRFGNAESTATVSASYSALGESVSDILDSSSDATRRRPTSTTSGRRTPARSPRN